MEAKELLVPLGRIAACAYGAYRASDNRAFHEIYLDVKTVIGAIEKDLNNDEINNSEA